MQYSRRVSARRWLLLIHQLPPRPPYLRAKIAQRLARVGAVALKNSVYVLPDRAECREDLQWIARQAVDGGGEAWVSAARFLDAAAEAVLVARCRDERAKEYRELTAELEADLRQARRGLPVEARSGLEARLERHRRRLEEIAGADFFAAPERRAAAARLAELRRRLGRRESARRRGDAAAAGRLVGKTWVTRADVFVDRLATAWLVRRFVDPRARFRFVAGDGAGRPRPGEVRFDMVSGDVTHEGERCTFETLLRRLGLADPALQRIAEIVHDLDLKDGKYGRAEGPGVKRLLDGVVRAHATDAARLERALPLFDDLYAAFTRARPRRAPRRRRPARRGR